MKIPVAGPEGPHAEDQRDERLPWPKLLKLAALALGLFALAGAAAVAIQRDEWSALTDGRAPAPRAAPPLIEHDTRAADLAAVRAAQLEEYGWVDHEQNLIRIPISRAMQRIAEGKR
jgi:hypothetical protein